MINWLKQLFHCHHWVIIKEVTLMNKGRQIGDRYIQKCSICGKIKFKDVC